MRSRTLAIAGSIAALSFAAVPVAAGAKTTHHAAPSAARVDRSQDVRGARHIDRTSDRTSGADRHSADTSRDVRDR